MKRSQEILAFAFGVPIAVLGGLIGLGGAEFRLPVLTGVLGHPARKAVSLNVVLSLVTICASLSIRSRTLSFSALEDFVPAILALACGGVTSAIFGARLVHNLPEETLERLLCVLLSAIGVLLLIEAFINIESGGLLAQDAAVQVPVGFVLGLGIGLVSSLLGVAGGELLIPAFVFIFGAPVKVAGTASLFVSLPTVFTGVTQHWRRGMLNDREALRRTVAPMAVASVIGSVIGGILASGAPVEALKLILGTILIVSAAKMYVTSRRGAHAKAAA